MDAGEQPPAVVPDGDVGGAESAVDRVALVAGLLGVHTDRDGSVAVVAHGHLVPHQGVGDQIAGAVAVQPLPAVEHEPDRSNEGEVLGTDLVERGDVTALLGLGLAAAELVNLACGGHGGLLFSG